jgi:hypothetical protein
VEDDGRAVLGEDLAHPLLLPAVREDRGEDGGVDVAVVLELALDPEEVVLGVVEEDQAPRRDARDLAAQLRPDRTAGARHQDDLAVEVGADAVDLHDHRVAAEEVLDLDLARLADEAAAGLQQLEDGRQRADGDLHARDTRARRAHARCPAPRGSR